MTPEQVVLLLKIFRQINYFFEYFKLVRKVNPSTMRKFTNKKIIVFYNDYYIKIAKASIKNKITFE